MNSFLNSGKLLLNTPIYRIIPKDRLLELFNEQKNILVRVKLWDDPFENFILNSKVKLKSGEMGQFSFGDDMYGQCWSLNKASDAMWRIYSPDNDGVRIKTTIGKLLQSLHDQLGKDALNFGFIGKVRYLNQKKLIKFAQTIFSTGITKKKIAETLLVKRRSFKHEVEIRLICISSRNDSASDLFSYDICPYSLIEQFMVDPRLSKSDAEKFKQKLIHETGFKGEVKRSLLYAPPPNMVFLL